MWASKQGSDARLEEAAGNSISSEAGPVQTNSYAHAARQDISASWQSLRVSDSYQ
jgi:hypothetical protein